MRSIGVVTVARSDYGIYRPVLERLGASPALRPALFVGGAHLSDAHGRTLAEIEQDGYAVAATVATLPSDETGAGIAGALGRAVSGFADALARRRPDLLLVLGDRWEMLAAAAAALPQRIPLGHLHGGESSEGAIDESIRHAITKLSHLHFASTERHARRIRQLGEEPWRVLVTGAPALDAVAELAPLADEELSRRLGLPLDPAPLVVTYHPATLDAEPAGTRIRALLDAVAASGLPAVLTYPGVDAGGAEVRAALEEYVREHPRSRLVASLGSTAYFSLLRRAAAMVGNSSSGIIEAASFGLPVVNVGSRQDGRTRAANVIDVPDDRDAILEGIRRATGADFRRSLAGLVNPYGDGHAAARIAAALESVELDERLLVKRFVDVDE